MQNVGIDGHNTASVCFHNNADATGAVEAMDTFCLVGHGLVIDIVNKTQRVWPTWQDGAEIGFRGM